eukprot:CAMPEP_0202896194 /NCGR_PEP_ID=MMETSP1392-20130828/5233_1 /ASSEMBLY_ACC=CAM_ASM_000868 /TAXON_ID=225041 /ORGANISM="Chlamydomonas chlamydogama, Strain SAG 11-48b" /LENGTH=139 /DNA_ID=CAMNT_0049581451 /DNA_START=316 /DNA_END=735 /DNA_ORIENTATION=-
MSLPAPLPEKAVFPAKDQLILEVFTGNLTRSMDYYRSIGFNVQRSEENFAVLEWHDDAVIYLEQIPEPLKQQDPGRCCGNIRLMVENVDAWYEYVVSKLGLPLIKDIGDRYYGLRDFTIAGPDGIGFRFAQLLDGGHLH